MVASEQHRRAERRLLPPRRSEIERRLGERRLQVISLDEDRRDQTERRRATDRRQPTGRRQAEARGDKLVVLVVSSQEDAARQVRGLLEGADPDRFGVVAAEPQASVARLARGGVDVVLLAMSLSALDDLKGVNDAAGHAVGDRALRDTAALLRQTFRDSDLVARIGGDEYAVLVRHAGPESAGVLAERLKRQLRDFNRRAGRPYQLSISLGFATHKASTLGSVAGLLDRADRALYRDKRRKHDAD